MAVDHDEVGPAIAVLSGEGLLSSGEGTDSNKTILTSSGETEPGCRPPSIHMSTVKFIELGVKVFINPTLADDEVRAMIPQLLADRMAEVPIPERKGKKTQCTVGIKVGDVVED